MSGRGVERVVCLFDIYSRGVRALYMGIQSLVVGGNKQNRVTPEKAVLGGGGGGEEGVSCNK